MLTYPAIVWQINRPHAANGYGTKMCTRNYRVPLAESQHHIINPTNSRGAFDDSVEDWLHVRGRAADNPEHLGRGRLMLQSLAQFRVALLDLLEQSHVLDRDDRLVGEGFDQLDLRRRESTRLGPTCGQRSNKSSLLSKGHRQKRACVARGT